jgi:hypothetical protein
MRLQFQTRFRLPDLDLSGPVFAPIVLVLLRRCAERQAEDHQKKNCD